jgi:hypothetical protein
MAAAQDYIQRVTQVKRVMGARMGREVIAVVVALPDVVISFQHQQYKMCGACFFPPSCSSTLGYAVMVPLPFVLYVSFPVLV